MTPEVILTLRRRNGADERIPVRGPSFTIGRSAENDLVVDEAGLSRRHALITVSGGSAQVADCGSVNGTRLNGRPVAGAAELRDGDVIELGEGCQIVVSLGAPQVAPVPAASREPVAPRSAPAGADSRVAPAPPAKAMNVPLIAGAVIVLILLVTVVAVIISQVGKSDSGKDRTVITQAEGEPTATVEPSVSPAGGVSPADTPEAGDEADAVEKAAVQVMRSVSNDRNYHFPPRALEEIRREVERYRSKPSLPGALGALNSRADELTAFARSEGLKPALLAYHALASTDGGERGDPVAAARQVFPELASVGQTLGTETADSSLIVVAASQIPGGTKKSHPLLAVMRRVVNNPTTERNVWFLRERGALDADAYAFVVRFLALGVIAENPRQFGVEASALSF
jgi:hypothetical protein